MPIIVVAPNASLRFGGEAMKAFQFFKHLTDRGHDARLITHERCAAELRAHFDAERLIFVSDTRLHILLWRSRLLRMTVNALFHLEAARIVRRIGDAETVVHYASPISPVQPRFPPKGYRVVIGPLNGDMSPPPGFGERIGRKGRIAARLHRPVQRVMGRISGDKRRADWLLNSGGERTRRSLRAAGAADARIVDVLDSGVDMPAEAVAWSERERYHFCCLARLDNWKGVDLAVRAMAALPETYRLTVLGNGACMADLVALRDRLGLGDRVDLRGYTDRPTTLDVLGRSRGLVFPSFNEANGIAVQEAMCLGTPVVALDHGGPAILLAEGRGFLIEPVSEEQIVRDLADWIRRLSERDREARDVAGRALDYARREFGWDAVAGHWTEVYDRPA